MGIFKPTKKQDKESPTRPLAPILSEKDSGTEISLTPVIKAGIVASTIIISPVVTEKSATLASQSQYVFRVEVGANKIQIRNAIRQMYNVTPVSVNTVSQDGKKVRRGRTSGVRKNWKKAIVTLPKGKTIEVYEGV